MSLSNRNDQKIQKMKIKPAIILGGCSVLGVMTVLVLFALTEDNSIQYDFVRVFQPALMSEDKVLDLGYTSYYIAGSTTDKIYFGNELAPLHMIVCNKDLTDTAHIRLSFENSENLKFKALQVKVDSPYFFVSEGTQPYLLRGELSDWKAKRFMYDSAYFSAAVPVSPTSIVLRARSAKTQEDVLGKETAHGVTLFPGLLEKQIDGVFCVDGMLHFNKTLQQVVYVYYYRNQYVVMDTSLQVRYRGNTIDPITRAQIKVDSFKSDGLRNYTMSAPPAPVNINSCVWDDWLLVNSAIRAKNESQKYPVIDAYNLKNGTYQFSFYVKSRYGRVGKLWVFNRKLYTVVDNYVARYTLPDTFFEERPNEKSL
jgi:hypothetical protein